MNIKKQTSILKDELIELDAICEDNMYTEDTVESVEAQIRVAKSLQASDIILKEINELLGIDKFKTDDDWSEDFIKERESVLETLKKYRTH